MSSEIEAVEQFSPNLPYSFEVNAQPGDCPNRLVAARLRRRARAFEVGFRPIETCRGDALL